MLLKKFSAHRYLIVLLLIFTSANRSLRAQYSFRTNNGAILVEKYTGPGGLVEIPSVVGGMPVVAILPSAFAERPVSRVIIPNTITNIAANAFAYCFDLEAFVVDPANEYYASLGNVLFNKGVTEMLVYPSAKLAGPYAIPSTVTNIAAEACFRNPYLSRLVIPDSVRTIQAGAFQRCESLAEISFGRGLVSIGAFAFAGTRIPQLETPPSLQVIEDYAFADTSLTNVTLSEGIQRLGKNVFSPYVRRIHLPASLVQLGRPAFANCGWLEAITVDPLNPNFCDVEGALFNREKRTIIQFPVTRNLTRYDVPSTVNVIGAGAFHGTSAVEVSMGDSVTTIEAQAFMASRLTNVILGPRVTTIGSNAFNLSIYLTSVRIPASVTTIESGAFSSCGGLGKVVFEGAPVSFGAEVFRFAYSITNVDLGTMTAVPNSFFKDCSRLREVIFPKTLNAIGDEAFAGTALREVRIGDNVKSIGYRAFGNCVDLKEVWVPAGVTNVADQAFWGDYNLRAVYFEGDMPQYLGANGGAPYYYLPGARGWSPTADARPILWNPTASMTDGNFAIRDGRFRFTVTGNRALDVVIQSADNPFSPVWTQVGMVSLANGPAPFVDPVPVTTSKTRFYRFRAN
jgi:hypothetical protein